MARPGLYGLSGFQVVTRSIMRYHFILVYIILILILISGCHAVTPGADTGDIIDASQNVSSALYHPVSRPDNPNPIRSFVFIRHSYYATQRSPWTLVSSGAASSVAVFEDIGVYFLRFTGSGEPDIVRLTRLPGLQTGGLTPPGFIWRFQHLQR